MTDLKILGIETSGKVASVALSEGSKILGEFTYATKLTHSQVILPLVRELLERLEISLDEVDCVAVSDGPGSYTGLRIGVAAAKGLSFGGKMKCFGASSLEALAFNVSAFDGTVAVIANARPGVVYFGGYRCCGGAISCIAEDRVCPIEEVKKLISAMGENVMLTGDMCEKVKNEMFADDYNVTVVAEAFRLQRASALCGLASARQELWTDGDGLDARYLQETKAEKDKRFSQKQTEG